MGIGITTQGETLIPVDESGKALSRAIVWLDGRAVEESAKFAPFSTRRNSTRRPGFPTATASARLASSSGSRTGSPSSTLRPSSFSSSRTYVILRLTGRFVTEKSLLSTTGYFDIDHDVLWEEMLSRNGLDKGNIPRPWSAGPLSQEYSPRSRRSSSCHTRLW